MEELNLNLYHSCHLCPRNCGANRLEGQTGFCGMTAELVGARAGLHYWEEPCLSGTEGSGTVFFTGCNLKCIFCQNREIALGCAGEKINARRLAQIFLELQEKKANNINLVTAVHYIPHIVWAVKKAREDGLQIPIVYNSSGYESVESLRLLDGIVDIYLPDFKYYSEELASQYSHAADYVWKAKESLAEMVRQVGEPCFAENGIMKKGVIVRHLILPGNTNDSMKIVKYLYQTYTDKIWISLMNQYTPVIKQRKYSQLNRRLTTYEYNKVVDYARELGVEQGFIQVGKTAKESFIPKFDGEGIL